MKQLLVVKTQLGGQDIGKDLIYIIYIFANLYETIAFVKTHLGGQDIGKDLIYIIYILPIYMKQLRSSKHIWAVKILEKI